MNLGQDAAHAQVEREKRQKAAEAAAEVISKKTITKSGFIIISVVLYSIIHLQRRLKNQKTNLDQYHQHQYQALRGVLYGLEIIEVFSLTQLQSNQYGKNQLKWSVGATLLKCWRVHIQLKNIRRNSR